MVSQQIDSLRKSLENDRIHRDRLDKFHVYAQVWDLRKEPEYRSILEAARELKLHPSTLKMRYYKAYELIHGKQYEPGSIKRSIRKQDLRKYCATCKDRETCKAPCPVVASYINQDKVPLREKLMPHWFNPPA